VSEARPADGRACLEQRFSPLLTVRTTLHDDGLVVQVNRPFRDQVAAVDFGRLVLEPAMVNSVRTGLLWLAGALVAIGGGCLLPHAQPWLGPAAGPLAAGLLAGAALSFVAGVASPRRLTLLLDRERALNPVFLRGGDDEAEVENFLHDVRRAAIAWRCRAAQGGPAEDEPVEPGLADALDKLHAMHAEELITERELKRFQELAVRRR
jgi:hypothetical protein